MIKIELSELPEFEKEIKITITLEKDNEGKVEGKIITPSTTSPIILDDNISDSTPQITKKRRTTSTKESREGSSVEEKVKPILSESITPKIEPTKVKSKSSGNLMGMDF